MIKIIIALTLLLLSSSAYCGKFSTTEYECSQMDVERDGFKCLVNDEGELLMRIHIADNAPKEKLERSKYLYEITRRNYLASGGQYVRVRNKHNLSKSGVELEKLCTRRRGHNELVCGDWYQAED